MDQSSFRDVVARDLHRAIGLVVAVQDELDPQFRLATPEGDHALAVTLSEDLRERDKMFARIATLMAVRQVVAFTLVTELQSPDVLIAVGVSLKGDVLAAMTRITRAPRPWTPANFSTVEWLGRESVGAEIIDLLPRGARTLTETELRMIEKWFGVRGRFPLLPIDETAI